MSSILEALRELEADRPPKAVHGVAHTASEAPRRGNGIPLAALAGGLVAGGLVAAVYLWSGGPTAPPNGSEVTPGRPAPATGPSQGRPAWLDGAEAPMARVTSGDAPSPVPTREAPPAPVAAPALPAAPADVRPARQVTTDVRSFQVESVEYDVPAARRSVTLRLNGDRVTLREGESADGVSVQLITPDGAYLQRGSEVFLATPRR